MQETIFFFGLNKAKTNKKYQQELPKKKKPKKSISFGWKKKKINIYIILPYSLETNAFAPDWLLVNWEFLCKPSKCSMSDKNNMLNTNYIDSKRKMIILKQLWTF